MGNWSLELHRDISYRIPATVTQRRLEVVVKSVKRICSRSIFRSFMHELRVDIHHCFAIAPVHITPIHSIANSNRAHTNHVNITLHWFHSTNTFNRIHISTGKTFCAQFVFGTPQNLHCVSLQFAGKIFTLLVSSIDTRKGVAQIKQKERKYTDSI